MNLIFRMIWLFATAWRRPAAGMLDETRIALRVLPSDLDTNMHMNNGRYLTIMDLGRVDMIIRTGMWRLVRERKWYPVLGGAQISFRRPLDPFQRYELTTRVMGWDEKWIFMEQRFEVAGTVHARAVVKSLFLKGRDKVPTSEIARAMGHEGAPPAMDGELIAALG